MSKINIKEILKKYREGNCTEEEIAFLESWVTTGLLEEKRPTNEEIDRELTLISHNLPLVQSERNIWPRFAAAASIIFCFSIGGYFLIHKPRVSEVSQNIAFDIKPGNSQATLILANGHKIILSKGLNGILAQQGNTSIRVKGGDEISYTSSDQSDDKGKIEYNTLSTKDGEQSPYPLILADGTKVWLNAASSITFPTAFYGRSRKVTITGEAYFEVAHNSAKPFSVLVNGQTIEDIGTHFNVNAYDDEQVMRTTLLEGSIRVIKGNNKAFLKPGQQSIIYANTNLIKINDVNTEQILAWKNGLFEFENADIQTMMRQISRWYDVDVAYEGNIPEKSISGKMYRNVNALQALQILTLLKIHYKIEQGPKRKKIIITP